MYIVQCVAWLWKWENGFAVLICDQIIYYYCLHDCRSHECKSVMAGLSEKLKFWWRSWQNSKLHQKGHWFLDYLNLAPVMVIMARSSPGAAKHPAGTWIFLLKCCWKKTVNQVQHVHKPAHCKASNLHSNGVQSCLRLSNDNCIHKAVDRHAAQLTIWG